MNRKKITLAGKSVLLIAGLLVAIVCILLLADWSRQNMLLKTKGVNLPGKITLKGVMGGIPEAQPPSLPL